MNTAIAVNGAAGRMGRQLMQAVAEQQQASLTEAFEHAGHASIGQDSSLLSGGPETGVLLADNTDAKNQAFDVVVDFTAPAVTLALLDALHGTDKAIVVGTTGFDEAQLVQLHNHARTRPVVFASNYSVGVTIALNLMADAAKALGDGYDVEITEAHHRHKVDAPSGTALSMGHAVAKRGAIRAACWLKEQPPGLYDMTHVLGIAS